MYFSDQIAVRVIVNEEPSMITVVDLPMAGDGCGGRGGDTEEQRNRSKRRTAVVELFDRCK